MLLREAGFDIEIVTKEVEEDFPDHLQREEVALYLSQKKSEAFGTLAHGQLLVTADTIVCLGTQVINKPGNLEEAATMLHSLSGRMHEVFTGITIRSNEKSHSFTERTEVYFKSLSGEEIAYYVENFKPLDKAGAYGIQEWLGYIGVSGISGCYYNVMGFPIARFYKELGTFLSRS